MKANFNLNEIITSSLWQEMVTENLHVFKGCAEAIDDISQTILNDYNNRKMLSKDTGWYFIANFNNAVTKRDVNSNDISYPIKIEYHPYPVFNTIMSVLDRKDHPTEIIISVDVVNFSQVLYDMYNQNCTDDEVYQYVHSKVSHEFGHIRENYGLAWITDFKNKMMNIIDVSQTKRYVTSNINKFFKFPDTTQDKQLELDDVYDVIKHIMYMFSPTEMN